MDDGEFEALVQRIEGKIEACGQRMLVGIEEIVRDTETRLLAAFYAWTESNNKRLTQMEANDLLLQQRVLIPENRITSVERRLNMPPQ
jgi:hypothetical protein